MNGNHRRNGLKASRSRKIKNSDSSSEHLIIMFASLYFSEVGKKIFPFIDRNVVQWLY